MHTFTLAIYYTILNSLRLYRSVLWPFVYFFLFLLYFFFSPGTLPHAHLIFMSSYNYIFLLFLFKKKRRKGIRLHIRAYIDTLPKRTIDTRKKNRFPIERDNEQFL